MPDLNPWPSVNAGLNAISAVLLTAGYLSIRRRHTALHRASMLSAFFMSTLFLISYVVYHANTGSRPFPGVGLARSVYFAILVTHVLLAAGILPLAGVTLSRGLRGRYDSHVRIARWTFPIWAYVSVTGVIIYLMLYRTY